jgi:hypothetical protein
LPNFLVDDDAVPVRDLAPGRGGGTLTVAQTHEFRDARTGASDIPIAHSGYLISVEVFPVIFIDPHNMQQTRVEWTLRTSKSGASTTANGIASGAGEGGPYSTLATVHDPLVSGP